jgi:hypothetical protein
MQELVLGPERKREDNGRRLPLSAFLSLLRSSELALCDIFRKSEVICDLLYNTLMCEHIYIYIYLSLVTMAWRILMLWMEEMASRYGG